MTLPKGPIKKPRTPAEKMTKGLWALRHYKGRANQSKEFIDKNGNPTKHALQAKRWGEQIPKNQMGRSRLVRLGKRLIKQAKEAKNQQA